MRPGGVFFIHASLAFRCLYGACCLLGSEAVRPLRLFGFYPMYNSPRFRVRGRGSGGYTSYKFICCFGSDTTAITFVLGKGKRLLIYQQKGRPTGNALSLSNKFVSVFRANRRKMTHRIGRRAKLMIARTGCLFSLPGACLCSNFLMRALSRFFLYRIRSSRLVGTVSSITST